MTAPRPCPAEVPPTPTMVDCPEGCGYSIPVHLRYRLTVHLMVGACRNRPRVAR